MGASVDSRFRRWWMMLRARTSLVSLLAERDPAKIVAVAAGINGTIALAIIAAAAWVSGRPLFFASLAPSAFVLFTAPFSPAAAPRSLILGHSSGICCGWAAWALISACAGRPLGIDDFGPGVIAGIVCAFTGTALLLVRLRSHHAPACATAVLVSSGSVTAPADLLVMGVAVVLLATVGGTLLRLGGVRAPVWDVRALPDDGR